MSCQQVCIYSGETPEHTKLLIAEPELNYFESLEEGLRIAIQLEADYCNTLCKELRKEH